MYSILSFSDAGAGAAVGVDAAAGAGDGAATEEDALLAAGDGISAGDGDGSGLVGITGVGTAFTGTLGCCVCPGTEAGTAGEGMLEDMTVDAGAGALDGIVPCLSLIHI